jgi:2-oxoglutarate ferredoxin oxidoreductase subunit gamma
LVNKDFEIVIAGFGGQGVLFAGMVLAHGALRTGKQVTWIPFYGPEMRGGTAGCTVIISDEEIGSPIINQPTSSIVMNEPSLAKWGPKVKPNGILVINRSLALAPFDRPDLHIIEVPATEIAGSLGSDRMANMVALGALLGVVPVLPMDVVQEALPLVLGAGKESLVEPNRRALLRGAELAVSKVLRPS